MKKLIGLFIVLGLIGFSLPAAAHPGNTDANGGHTCRTNCSKWNLKQGQYHKHNPKKAKTSAKKSAKKGSKSASK
jgi:hypothetical protein